MLKQSAGILMYRFKKKVLEVFLVHLGGPYWEKKDLGAWSIPKGEFTHEEDPLEAAKREFKEETGFAVEGRFIPLTPIKQKSGKVVYVWAVEEDCDPKAIKSNTFFLEWPPRSGMQQGFPEVDRAGWFTVEAARKKLFKGQVGFLEELSQAIFNDQETGKER
jgi:predicted NUDIX family NTP pyrophosphohydrolase